MSEYRQMRKRLKHAVFDAVQDWSEQTTYACDEWQPLHDALDALIAETRTETEKRILYDIVGEYHETSGATADGLFQAIKIVQAGCYRKGDTDE